MIDNRRVKEKEIRIKIVIFLLISIWVFFFAKLGYIQIFRKGYYSEKSQKQSVEKIIVWPERGKIFDRNGKLIATNVKTTTLVAFPRKIKDKKKTALLLSEQGYGSFDKLYRDIKRKNFIYIKRNLEKKPPKKIKEIEGIDLLQDRKRFYPYGSLCSSLIGFVGTEYSGLEGLEFEFDTLLGGKPGWAHLQKSPMGLLYPHPALPRKSPKSGKDIALTIDIDIQSIVHSELEKVIKSTSAKGGIVVVVNPRTGEILAMVNVPGYDPNYPLQYDNKLWINCAISELFEPGSTFKIVTATAALEEKLFNLDDIVEDGKGVTTVGRVKIKDAEKHGPLTFVEFVEHSSNVAATKIAQKIGKKKFYCYIRAFGFGSRTKIRLPGEEKGFVGSPFHWTPLKFATISFGQGVSVTALQLIYAYSAIANDGVLLNPFLVRSIISNKGDTLYTSTPVVVRRVMKEETAQILKDILLGAVDSGTGKFARINGIDIAGKTGTAEKSKPVVGYGKGEYVASFIGFLPAKTPQLLIGVFIDEPKEGLHWGGYVAAPLFRKIAQRILYLDKYNDKIFNDHIAKGSRIKSDETVKDN
ncbi:MAG: penicillin-binding protein 2 [Candidatus Cloacimonadota bacterium]|nr:MAG: penicillin-binding protein 2 [Candidatus Cloacimonadota bacterium]